MALVLGRPDTGELAGIVDELRQWQREGAPMQLHPGDLGWHWRFGAEATAAAVRTWSRDGRILGLGLLDGPGLLRLAIAPGAEDDGELAQRLVDDVAVPQGGILPAGKACIEMPHHALARGLLAGEGWDAGESWTPLRCGLSGPVKEPGVAVAVAGPGTAQVRAAVQRAAFDGSSFTAGHWSAMSSGVAYADARCLLAYDDHGDPAATATVWSAGPGRPGLLEPMGVHHGHRGRGFGTAITIAALAALRELGSSSALVCTPTSNAGAVATYEAAGFEAGPDIRDLSRGA